MWGQTYFIKGTVSDQKTKQPLANASVTVAESFGAYTDEAGNFSIQIENLAPPYEVLFSFVGYADKREKVTIFSGGDIEMEILLEPTFLQGDEVVISGSRVSEKVQESPVSIQKINLQAIRATPSGDFYEGLGNLKGVDMVTSSLGFRAFNTRGFNTTSPVRVVQFIDGMDNQAPGLNFPVGNLVGATDLDLQSVEVITGPASALYGPNAFQGVISMMTKDPFNFQGLSVQLKGGNRNLMDGQFRYAKALGKSQRFAFKVTGSYTSATDFAADDPNANLYGDITTVQDLSAVTRQLQYADDSSTAATFTALNAYLDFYPVGNPGKVSISTPGYQEKLLTDYKTKSLKLGGEVAYKIKDSLQLSFAYKYGNGTAVYQGTNRYNIKNITFHQQKIELQGKRFTVRAYNTLENAGDSYDLVFTALNLSRAGVRNYVGEYLSQYFATLRTLTDDFSNEAAPWMADSSHTVARAFCATAPNIWLKPGTTEFDTTYRNIITNANLSAGSKFTDRSSIQHVEGQYNVPVKWANILTGANFRRYNPQSFGTIFRDTLVNRGDTLPNGAANLNARFTDLSLWEVGGFVQASKKVWKNKLNLIASVRADKNQNFQAQFSPRASAILTQNKHVFRVSAQSAFRIPTLQNQYILLTLAQIPAIGEKVFTNIDFRLQGNLDGYNNQLFTPQSVINFMAHYDSTFDVDTKLLKTYNVDALRPEQLRTVEVGYRTAIDNKFFVDAVGYFNWYKDFIGDVRAYAPRNGIPATPEEGADAILTGNYDYLQIPVNSSQLVTTYGAAIGLSYYFGKGISSTLNYTYSNIDTSKIAGDNIIPGFNTPKNKISLGVNGSKVWKGAGFNVNFRWQEGFYWQSPFGQGKIPAYSTLDAQLNYAFEKLHSTLRIGGSNLLNQRYRTAYGSPLLGRMGYVSWTFDFGQ